MEAIIRSVGRLPRQRDTLYSDVSDERYRASFAVAGGGAPAVAATAMMGASAHGSQKSHCSNDSTTL
jgi:hypothetical protein